MGGLSGEQITSILTLALGSSAIPIIISALLGRKGANKKLQIEEGGLTVDQFNAALPAYKDLLDRADRDRDEAIEKLGKYESERIELLDRVRRLERADTEKTTELEITSRALETLRKLFQTYVDRTGIPLTTQEQAVFENTQPVKRHRLVPKPKTN